jgi:hypothetical protein
MSMAIADSEAFLKRNFLVLLDIEDGVQPARRENKPGTTTGLHGGFSLQYQGLSPGKPVFILQKALSICREAVY